VIIGKGLPIIFVRNLAIGFPLGLERERVLFCDALFLFRRRKGIIDNQFSGSLCG
jgi:hypothetical protein